MIMTPAETEPYKRADHLYLKTVLHNHSININTAVKTPIGARALSNDRQLLSDGYNYDLTVIPPRYDRSTT